eukprot:284818327_4
MQIVFGMFCRNWALRGKRASYFYFTILFVWGRLQSRSQATRRRVAEGPNRAIVDNFPTDIFIKQGKKCLKRCCLALKPKFTRSHHGAAIEAKVDSGSTNSSNKSFDGSIAMNRNRSAGATSSRPHESDVRISGGSVAGTSSSSQESSSSSVASPGERDVAFVGVRSSSSVSSSESRNSPICASWDRGSPDSAASLAENSASFCSRHKASDSDVANGMNDALR